MTRINEKTYLHVSLMSLGVKAMLSELGIIESDMSLISEAETNRQTGASNHPVHTLPFRENVKRGPGRPKGAKNKKTKLKEKTAKTSRKPGRPKGAKNKSTLEKTRKAAETKQPMKQHNNEFTETSIFECTAE